MITGFSDLTQAQTKSYAQKNCSGTLGYERKVRGVFYIFMDLEKFFLVTNIQKRAFAYMVNISESALNNYIHKRRTPRLDIAYRIVKATKGKVTIEDLMK